jgi:hypothetical protein
MPQKQQRASRASRMRNPRIGKRMMITRLVMTCGADVEVAEGVIAVVVVGNSVELKILEGAIANASPSGV